MCVSIYEHIWSYIVIYGYPGSACRQLGASWRQYVASFSPPEASGDSWPHMSMLKKPRRVTWHIWKYRLYRPYISHT